MKKPPKGGFGASWQTGADLNRQEKAAHKERLLDKTVSKLQNLKLITYTNECLISAGSGININASASTNFSIGVSHVISFTKYIDIFINQLLIA